MPACVQPRRGCPDFLTQPPVTPVAIHIKARWALEVNLFLWTCLELSERGTETENRYFQVTL